MQHIQENFKNACSIHLEHTIISPAYFYLSLENLLLLLFFLKF